MHAWCIKSFLEASGSSSSIVKQFNSLCFSAVEFTLLMEVWRWTSRKTLAFSVSLNALVVINQQAVKLRCNKILQFLTRVAG